MEHTLGKRIVQNRKRLGLTQDQLAEKLGVTAQAVSKWENDQSCPDITMLPRLAEIFDTSTDALLGREKVHHAQIVQENQACKDEGFHVQKGNWEFTFDGGRRSAVGMAVYVLVFGILLLLNQLLHWEGSFWAILWPWTLTAIGLFGILRKMSFFHIGMLLFGLYALLDNIGLLPFQFRKELVLPAIVVLLGLSLLSDAIRKPRNARWHLHHRTGKHGHGSGNLKVDGESFSYSGSFGETVQVVQMPHLCEGSISASFGEFTVDLSGVEKVAADCMVSANCNFGELTILIPKRFQAISYNSTSFAQIQTNGTPDEHPQGVIKLEAHASFGEITIQYI